MSRKKFLHLFTKNEQMLLIQLKKTTRIQEYFANLSILQDFSQECVIEGTQGTSMKVIQASLMCNMLKYLG
jgi:hypothetical protein